MTLPRTLTHPRKLTYQEQCILKECCEAFVPLAQCERLWYTPRFELVFAKFVKRTGIDDMSFRGVSKELTAMRKKGSSYWRVAAVVTTRKMA
jgi:hypothetical protein